MAEPGKLLFVTPKSERKLRQLVGAPNTTDYGKDGTVDTPQQNIKRKDTNTATAEVTTDYQGMFHLGVETETVNGTEKVYLTVDWPESGSGDETLVGIYRNKEIHYTAKSILLTEDINIYLDIYRLKIIAANPNRQTIGSYWKLIGQYNKTAGTVSQLWRDDRANDGALYSGYTGMFHVFLDVEVTADSSGDVTSETLYLNVDWPESTSGDQTVVGNYNNTAIHWYSRQEIPEGGGMIVFDPNASAILMVKSGDVFVSYWKVIASYNANSKTVYQNWRNDRPGDGTLFSGYSGAFAIRYDKDAGTVQITGGNVSINNTNYTAADFTGSMGESSTMYYYARHRVAQSASSGDEDPDLTEEQKQALRTTIANCDSAISTATQAISGYQQQINALVTQRNTAYSAIATANSTYDRGVSTENNRHVSAINAENADYNQKVATENQLHTDNLNNLDPTASDYNQKVAAENNRHNAKLQELLTAHNTAISSENSLHSTNLATLASTRSSAVSAQQTIISGLNSQIATLRGNIQTQQGIINTQTQTKNVACLQLYGVIPASAGVEIIGLPSTQNTAQTDQYLFIYLGQVSRATATVSGVSVDRITVTQGYLGSIMAFYRISSACTGLM